MSLGKVAITGGIASGKTTVCKLLAQLGADVISADAIVHQLLANDEKIIAEVIQIFGPNVFVGGCLDCKGIAQLAFSHPDLLSSLEQLLHPVVFAAIEDRYQEASKLPERTLFVAEIPLLFESGRSHDFHKTICVLAEEALCRQRYRGEDYVVRSSRQWPQEKKAAHADIVIENNGDEVMLWRAVQTAARWGLDMEASK